MIRNTSVRRRDGRDINPWCIDQSKNMCRSRIINMLGPIKTDSNWLVLEQTASTWIIDSVSRRMGNDNEQASVKSSEFRKKVGQGLRRTIEQDNYKKVSLQVFFSKFFDLDGWQWDPPPLPRSQYLVYDFVLPVFLSDLDEIPRNLTLNFILVIGCIWGNITHICHVRGTNGTGQT